MAMSAEHRSKFALHRKWWSQDMNEKSSSEMKTPRQINKIKINEAFVGQ